MQQTSPLCLTMQVSASLIQLDTPSEEASRWMQQDDMHTM